MSRPERPSDRLARRIMWGLVWGVALGLLGRLLLWWGPEWSGAVNWPAVEVLDLTIVLQFRYELFTIFNFR